MTISIYQHTDTNAPQLTNTQGSINTILEWTLTQSGWTIPFRDDPNKVMCFQSGDVSSTQAILRVDDSVADGAAVKGYETMTDVEKGTGAFHVNNAHFGRENGVGWLVVSDEKGFYFCPRITISNNDLYHIYYFGDINSLNKVDAGCCVLFSNERTGYYIYNWTSGSNGKSLMGNSDLTERNIAFEINTCSPRFGDREEAWGDSDRRELYQSFVYHDNSNRGVFPGLYVTPTRLDSNDATVLTDIDGMGSEEVLLLPNSYSSSKRAVGISLSDWGR